MRAIAVTVHSKSYPLTCVCVCMSVPLNLDFLRKHKVLWYMKSDKNVPQQKKKICKNLPSEFMFLNLGVGMSSSSRCNSNVLDTVSRTNSLPPSQLLFVGVHNTAVPPSQCGICSKTSADD